MLLYFVSEYSCNDIIFCQDLQQSLLDYLYRYYTTIDYARTI